MTVTLCQATINVQIIDETLNVMRSVGHQGVSACPIDEFDASRHVRVDSPDLHPLPTPERVLEFP